MGSELKGKYKRPSRGSLPRPLGVLEISHVTDVLLRRLHGAVVAVPEKWGLGLRAIGEIKTLRGGARDLVLAPLARKAQARAALKTRPNEKVEDLALRQLAIAMLDSSPVPRLCAAYAYWQATGAKDAAIPVLAKSLSSEDEDERLLAAHCLAKMRSNLIRPLVGTSEDDKPIMSKRAPGLGAMGPVAESMTVIIHGTFAKDYAWDKPGGDFHMYLQEVYGDVYSGDDYFFWSGRYTDQARKDAAKKLTAWCNAHPANTLRLVGHSHGANVANIAVKNGLQSCTLIHLSPPVHDEYLPQISNVTRGRFFTIRPRIDLVVFFDGGRQDYGGTPVEAAEKRKICATSGHSESHNPRRWGAASVPNLVRTVCV